MMARKVFISFLGTNNYLQTHYELNGKHSPAVRFIQQALIGFLCKDWTENDSILMFYTGGANGSYVKNWLDNGQTFFNEDEQIEKVGLRTILQNMKLPMNIESYEIVEGFSEEDIWSIFDCVYDKLQEGDEIYFDVTHAFRSIPLFSTVLFNYTRFMKNTKLISIHYGAFEKLGPMRDVKSIPLDKRIAPIVDLTSLVDLQNTNVAASNFIEFGKVGTIAKQLDVMLSPVTKVQRKSYMAIKCLKEELEKLDAYILTCRMSDIRRGKYIRIILEQFNKAMQSDKLLSSEKLLLEKIKENLSAFKGEDTEENIAAAVQWAARYGMLQQAYTLGQELVITKVCGLLHEYNPYNNDKRGQKNFRLFVGSILGIADHAEYEGELAKYCELADELLAMNWIKKLRKYYDVLRLNRNCLNHAKGGDKSTDDLKRDFDMAYQECTRILNCWKTNN